MSTDGIPEATDERYDYDLVVVGTGPGGQKAAIAAAKLGHKVAIIERRNMMGGVSTNTGTIPSKTLREAVMYLTGMAQREVYGASYRVKSDITMEDLFARTQHVIGREHEVIRAQLLRNHIDILSGTGSFLDAHTLGVLDDDGIRRTQVTARFVVIATGSKPHRPTHRAVRRAHGARLRRRPRAGEGAELDGGRRRRDHRHRVRVDVRRPRHARHRHRQAPGDARDVRPGGRRVAEVPPAGPVGVVPVRRGGRPASTATRTAR